MTAPSSADHLSPDGRPVPPVALRRLSVNSDDAAVFFDEGQRLFRALEARLAESGGGFVTALRILDLDCGAGFIARWPRFAPGTVFVGLDESSAAVAWCRAELYGRFEVWAPGAPLPLEDGAFDLVYAAGTLTVPTAEIERVLAPGGRLVLADEIPVKGKA